MVRPRICRCSTGYSRRIAQCSSRRSSTASRGPERGRWDRAACYRRSHIASSCSSALHLLPTEAGRSRKPDVERLRDPTFLSPNATSQDSAGSAVPPACAGRPQWHSSVFFNRASSQAPRIAVHGALERRPILVPSSTSPASPAREQRCGRSRREPDTTRVRSALTDAASRIQRPDL